MIDARPLVWWETRAFVVALMLAAALPLIGPPIPPLADLPGHIGRYHIAANLADSPALQAHWRYGWAWVGNLGVDLPATLLTPWLGAELAAKLVVLTIPPLFVLGCAALSHAADGQRSPALAASVPLAYAYPFQLGFVNFMLAAALALLALAGWLRLADRPMLRTALFAPAAGVLWTAHVFGWALFGLAAIASDLGRRRRPATAIAGAVPLAWPALLMFGGSDGLGAEWDWQAKAAWFASLLRDRWKWFDVGCAILLYLGLWTAVRSRRTRFVSAIGFAALATLAAFALLPRLMLGGAYVDMRMLAPALALALVAIRIDDQWLAGRIALAATGFAAVRLAATVASFQLYAAKQAETLAMLPAIPRGAAVLVLVDEACTSEWRSDRLGHIAGIATARRDVFENGQWALAGQQLLHPRHPTAEPYRSDPSQLVYPATCDYRQTDFTRAIAGFDRATFTHVWTIGFPPSPRLAGDVVRIAQGGGSTLYRVAPPRLPPPPPAP